MNFVSYSYNSVVITWKCLYASSVAKEFQNNCGNYTTYKQNFQGRQLIITYVHRKGLATWDYCICTNLRISQIQLFHDCVVAAYNWKILWVFLATSYDYTHDTHGGITCYFPQEVYATSHNPLLFPYRKVWLATTRLWPLPRLPQPGIFVGWKGGTWPIILKVVPPLI